MKKFMLTMAVALLAITMNAQNNFYVGGSIGYSSSSYDGSATKSSLTFLPEFGIQFNKKIGIGVELGYNATTNEVSNLTNSTFEFAPYFRYTAFQLGKVSVFGDGKIAYSTRNNETAGSDGKTEDNKTNDWGIYVQPGIAYSLNDKFSLIAKFGNVLGYSSSKPDVSGAKATTTFQFLTLSNNVSFGFFYNF